MAVSHNPESATIYQFPSKGTRLGGSRLEDGSTKDRKAPRVQFVEFGSGWYHEAAVQDADRNEPSSGLKLLS